MKMILNAKGSGESIYQVTVSESADGVVVVMCSCTAGASGMMCKHRAALLENRPGEIFSADQIFSDALSLLIRTQKVAAHAEYLKSIDDLEQELNRIKKAQQSVKKIYARVLLGIAPKSE